MGNRYVILSRGVSSILDTSRDFLIRGHGMNVNAVKHQAKLQEWKGRVADCRSSGMSVKHWCEENDCSPRTYYRWEQEILGKVRQITKAESQPVLAELPVIKSIAVGRNVLREEIHLFLFWLSALDRWNWNYPMRCHRSC